VKKLEEMEKTAGTYRNLMEHTRRLLRAFFDLSQAHRGSTDNSNSSVNKNNKSNVPLAEATSTCCSSSLDRIYMKIISVF